MGGGAEVPVVRGRRPTADGSRAAADGNARGESGKGEAGRPPRDGSEGRPRAAEGYVGGD
jgi:hypothetical protein